MAARCLWPGSRGGASFQKPSVRCGEPIWYYPRLQKLFQELHGCGVMEFFTLMKIDTAKELIRSNQMNFTQISDRLGYTSIHYFSRQIKKITHMNPSEYASSIRLLSEKHPAQKED